MKKPLIFAIIVLIVACAASLGSQSLILLQQLAGTNADTQLLFNQNGKLQGLSGFGLDNSTSPTQLNVPLILNANSLLLTTPLASANGGLGFNATNCLTGQLPVGVNGTNMVCASPGTGQRTVSGTTDTINCDGATAIGDENSTILYTNASGGSVTVPQQNSAGCLNMSFVTVAGPGAGSWVFTPTTSTITWVKDGTSGATGATSITLTQYEVAIWTPAASNNYLVRIQ